MAQSVKNPPTVQETWVQSPGWKDPLEEGKATHSGILAWRIPMDRGAWQSTGHKELDMTEWLTTAQHADFEFISDFSLSSFPICCLQVMTLSRYGQESSSRSRFLLCYTLCFISELSSVDFKFPGIGLEIFLCWRTPSFFFLIKS